MAKRTVKSMVVALVYCLLTISCNSDNDGEKILFMRDNMEALNCGCDAEFIKDYRYYETILINSTDSSYFDQDVVNALVYNEDSSAFFLFSKHTTMIGSAYICNSNWLINNWDFESYFNTKIKLNGKEFKPCNPQTSFANYTYSDLLITEIKQSK